MPTAWVNKIAPSYSDVCRKFGEPRNLGCVINNHANGGNSNE